MAIIQSFSLRNLQDNQRIDAEFYQPLNLKMVKQLRTYPTRFLSRLAYVTDGEHGSPDWDANSGIKYITAEHIKGNFIDDTEFNSISAAQYKRNIRCSVREKDVLIYSVGAFAGLAAKGESHLIPASIPRSVALARVNDDSNVYPEFLSTFLNCKFGLFQSFRYRAGNSQPVLAIEKIKQFEIPLLSDNFQKIIKSLWEQSYNGRVSSKQSFEKAKQIFLSSLGLENWKPKHKKAYQRTFSEVQNSYRMDGEHFQPKYDELQKIIHKNAIYFKTIGSIKTFNQRGTQPKYFEDGTLKVITSQHILETHLDYDNFERTKKSFWDSERESRVFKNDILIYTTGANIGRTNLYLQDEKALASNHINILRIKEENPIYVGFALNSIVGRMQTEKHKTGSAQAEIYPSGFNQFIIPFIDKKKQELIAELYVQSYELSKQSKQLIAKAKLAVEIAIEKDEETAIKALG